MRVLVACKRGNVADRSTSGHCLCADCLAFRAAYRKANPRTEYKASWLAANKDRSAAYQAKWVASNKEKRRSTEASWKARNPEKVAAMNAKAGAKWAKNNKGLRNASVRARLLAKINRTPAWADLVEIAAVYRLAERLTQETGEPHEVDHVFPLQGKTVSGLHVHNNLQVLTRFANRSKGTKLCAV